VGEYLTRAGNNIYNNEKCSDKGKVISRVSREKVLLS